MAERVGVSEPHDLLEAFIAEQRTLLVIAHRIVRCGSDAEDIVQDVAMKLCRASEERTVLCPIGYLRSMVRNQALDRLRRAAHDSPGATSDVDLETIVSGEQGPQGRMEEREALRTVAAALAGLPERTRSAFLAHRLAGEPQNIIAARLGVSPTLVNFMVRDATLACRRAVDAAGGVPPRETHPRRTAVRASARTVTGGVTEGLREAG